MGDINIAVYGVPWDEKSSFMRGCRDAPGKIWDAYNCESANRTTESGINLSREKLISYNGTIDLSNDNTALKAIEAAAAEIGSSRKKPMFLGGDHAITYPLIKGLSRSYEDLTILHFDAHPDLYDELYGDKFAHGCPFARILEEKLIKRLVSVGIRSMTRHQQNQAERFGVEVIDMIGFDSTRVLSCNGPVYLSLDLDVLDPAFVPGVSHHEPGGMTTRELIRVIQNIDADLIGADIVEYNPYRDIQNVTAMVAAKLMKEIAAKMLSGTFKTTC